MEPEVKEFLRKRNIPERTIQQLENENIDGSLLLCISSEELSRFIPKLGDRIAIQNFCREIRNENKNKRGLIERLRRRMVNSQKKRESDSNDEETEATKISEKSTKPTRQIEIGWIHQGKQVRTKLGGGTRKTDVPKTARKNDILKIAKDLFFPNNQSTKGPLDNFSVDLKDFKMNEVNSDCNIEDIYRLTKLSRVRFYLTTDLIYKNSLPKSIFRKKGLPIISDSSDDDVSIKPKSQPEATVTSGAYEKLVNEPAIQNSGLSTTTINLPYLNDTNYFYEDLELCLFNGTNNESNNPQNNEALYDETHTTENNEAEYIDTHTTQVSQNNQTKTVTVLNIMLHRGQVLKELISSFVDVNTPIDDLAIVIEMIMPNGKKEADWMWEECSGMRFPNFGTPFMIHVPMELSTKYRSYAMIIISPNGKLLPKLLR